MSASQLDRGGCLRLAPRRAHARRAGDRGLWGAHDAALDAIASACPRLGPVVAGTASALVRVVGLVNGTHVAGAGDSYGYASQADLWASGRLRVEQPLMDELTWPLARQAM